jgi:hypothetical protein
VGEVFEEVAGEARGVIIEGRASLSVRVGAVGRSGIKGPSENRSGAEARSDR